MNEPGSTKIEPCRFLNPVLTGVRQDRDMTQKNITLLSLCAVVLGAVVVNEIIIRSSDSEQDRQVASFGERFEPKQIKWEQELAQSVSKETNTKTVLGKKPNLQDRLLFEVFEGHYEASLSEGKIQKISLMQNQSGIQLNTEDFLRDYVPSIKAYDSYEISKPNSNSESVQLKGKDGKPVGQLQIQRDDQGRVLQIEVQ